MKVLFSALVLLDVAAQADDAASRRAARPRSGLKTLGRSCSHPPRRLIRAFLAPIDVIGFVLAGVFIERARKCLTRQFLRRLIPHALPSSRPAESLCVAMIGPTFGRIPVASACCVRRRVTRRTRTRLSAKSLAQVALPADGERRSAAFTIPLSKLHPQERKRTRQQAH
jgi:hypothetical protein